MKIRSDQLMAQLQRGLSPVYIVSGDEPLQILECSDLIRQHARQQGFMERKVYEVDKQFDWSEFLEAANSLSLFSQRQILELRMHNKPDERARKTLTEYIKHPSEDNLVLVTTDRIDSATQKSKWFSALENRGIFVPVWPVEHHKLPGWIARRLGHQGFEATPEAISLLAERIEGNLLAAAQEIEKLKLLAKNNRIDASTVRDIVSNNARFDVFQLADAALGGDIKSVIHIFSGLKSEGLEPPIVLWALSRDIRLLSHLAHMRNQGVAYDAALDKATKAHGFAPFMLKKRKGLIDKCLARHSESTLRHMLMHCNQIDKATKGIEPLSTWDELLSLSMQLARSDR